MRYNIAFVFLAALFACSAFSQSRSITGTVTMNGLPVKGLTVYTSFATVTTDALGRYVMPLNGCPKCEPGYTMTIYTISRDTGSSQQQYTINNDYKFDFSIAKSAIVINGMVQSTGLRTGPLASIEVRVISGDIEVPPVRTNSFGEFKIPVHRNLLENANAVRLQVRDPDGNYVPLRIDPELFSISSFIIIRMQPGNAFSIKVGGYTPTTICVNEGDLVNIEAEGHIRVGTFIGMSDPEGRPTGVVVSAEAFNIIGHFNHAALMYRVSGKNKWLLAGRKKQFIVGPGESGCLEFQVNDNTQYDNYGEYTVKVSVVAR